MFFFIKWISFNSLIFSAFAGFLLGWITYWKFWGEKQSQREKNRKEKEKKLLANIKNFSPVRLKNRTWQKIQC